MRGFSKMQCAVILALLFVGCSKSPKKDEVNNSDEKISELIRSDDPDRMVEGFYLIGEKKMTKYIPDIFREIDDPRISHHINFKGISIYQSKIIALSKISGLKPPRKISYKPDTLIVDFYLRWAKDKKYLE